MYEATELQETIKFYEMRIGSLEEQYRKTDDIGFGRYILVEIDILEETLEALKSELKKVQELL